MYSTLLVIKFFSFSQQQSTVSISLSDFQPSAEHEDDENAVELLHLFGTSTPLGIIAPFIRTCFPEGSLPYYIYSIGRNYTPHSGQSSCIELLGKIIH